MSVSSSSINDARDIDAIGVMSTSQIKQSLLRMDYLDALDEDAARNWSMKIAVADVLADRREAAHAEALEMEGGFVAMSSEYRERSLPRCIVCGGAIYRSEIGWRFCSEVCEQAHALEHAEALAYDALRDPALARALAREEMKPELCERCQTPLDANEFGCIVCDVEPARNAHGDRDCGCAGDFCEHSEAADMAREIEARAELQEEIEQLEREAAAALRDAAALAAELTQKRAALRAAEMAKAEDMARDAETKHELRQRIAQLGKRSRQLDEAWQSAQERMRELENDAARIDAELDSASEALLKLEPDCELEAIMYGAG